MSESLQPATAFATLADSLDIADTPGWINRVRKAIRTEGLATRSGPNDLSIQAKSLRTNEWAPIMTVRNGTQFVSAEERDEVLRLIQS